MCHHSLYVCILVHKASDWKGVDLTELVNTVKVSELIVLYYEE